MYGYFLEPHIVQTARGQFCCTLPAFAVYNRVNNNFYYTLTFQGSAGLKLIKTPD